MREAQIKAALIDRLFLDGFIDNATVVISELPVSSWARRADLVLANGKLLGFEIKSKFDSTARLSAQLEAYADCFEGVSVVIDKKHLRAVESLASTTVGIFIIDEHRGAAEINMVRKPHLRGLSMSASLRLMMTDDLRRLLRQHDLKPDRSLGRQGLEHEVGKLRLQIVRNAAVDALKSRYISFHTEFFNARNAIGGSSLLALPSLRRPTWLTPGGNSVKDPALGRNTSDREKRPEHEQTVPLFVRPRVLAS